MTSDPADAGVASDDGGTLFASLLLEGERFDGPGMPTQNAREVDSYRDAVLEAARVAWLEMNPDRSNLPAGFKEAFDLRLTTVLAGSAKPQMVLHKPPDLDEATWAGWVPIYEMGRDKVTAVVQSASQPSTFAGAPRRMQRAVHKLGATLREGEVLEVGAAKLNAPRARLDQDIRRTLQVIDEVLREPQDEVNEFVGVIVEYDSNGYSFRLRVDDEIVLCRLDVFDEELAEKAREFLALDGVTAPDVRVEGSALLQAQGHRGLYNVHTIELVRSLGEKSLVSRLRELEALTEDWLEPGSGRPSPTAIRHANLAIADLAAAAIDVYLVPTASGSIVVEWRRGDAEFSAELDEGGTMFLWAEFGSGEMREAELKWSLTRLREFIRTGEVA